MRIIVTGATGRLGANVVKRLAEQGHEVVGCLLPKDRQEAKLDSIRLEKKYLDITNAEAVAAAIRGADAVVHTAAVMENMLDKMPPSRFFDINVKGSFNVLEGIRSSGKTTRLVCLSSTAVYDVFTAPRTPICEDMERKPIVLYGMNKILVEEMVRQYGFQYDIPFTLIRPNYIVAGTEVLEAFTCQSLLGLLLKFKNQKKCQFHVEGKSSEWLAAKTMLEKNKDAICIPRCAGGQSWRWHLTDVRDAIAFIELCLTHPGAVGHTFNLAAADACDFPVVMPYLAKKTGRAVVDVPMPNLWQLSFDLSAARNKLGFTPRYDHKAIIDAAIAMKNKAATDVIPGEIAPLAFE